MQLSGGYTMGAVQGLAHVAIAVTNIDEAIKFFQDKYGATLDTSKEPDGKLDFGLHISAIMRLGTMAFELMQPTKEGAGPVGKFIAKNGGGGIHHISLKVKNFAEAKDSFTGKGLEVLGETELWGGFMAFLHPKSNMGCLFEFTEVE
jgi:methylmalonyl-CoA/ethylmalonyl-CoA epimerase